MKAISIDEKEELMEIMSLDGYAILLREMEKLSISIQAEVLQYDLANGDDRRLALIKARGEGAMKLYIAFRNHMRKIKNPAEEIKGLN